MDDPGIDPLEHRRALRGLERINAVSFAATPVAREIIRMAQRRTSAAPERPLHIIDVACGGGDMLRRVRDRLHARGIDARFTGMDISTTAIQHARQHHADRQDTTLLIGDALQAPIPPHDVVMCSLFLHHLERTQAASLLSSMREAARLGVVVNDLRRTTPGYVAAWVGTRLLSRSPVVHQDGPSSVRAAWTGDELLAIAREAGMHNPALRYHLTQRMTLAWNHTP